MCVVGSVKSSTSKSQTTNEAIPAIDELCPIECNDKSHFIYATTDAG